MSPKRIKEMYVDFKKALARLKEALEEDLGKGSIVIDGAIQRFEFTFELAWKLGKAMLSYSGIEADSPRFVIKEAYKAKIFADGQGWIDMLEDRNKTAHIYDEKSAKEIYKKIKKSHLPLLEDFLNKSAEFLKS